MMIITSTVVSNSAEKLETCWSRCCCCHYTPISNFFFLSLLSSTRFTRSRLSFLSLSLSFSLTLRENDLAHLELVRLNWVARLFAGGSRKRKSPGFFVGWRGRGTRWDSRGGPGAGHQALRHRQQRNCQSYTGSHSRE